MYLNFIGSCQNVRALLFVGHNQPPFIAIQWQRELNRIACFVGSQLEINFFFGESNEKPYQVVP